MSSVYDACVGRQMGEDMSHENRWFKTWAMNTDGSRHEPWRQMVQDMSHEDRWVRTWAMKTDGSRCEPWRQMGQDMSHEDRWVRIWAMKTDGSVGKKRQRNGCWIQVIRGRFEYLLFSRLKIVTCNIFLDLNVNQNKVSIQILLLPIVGMHKLEKSCRECVYIASALFLTCNISLADSRIEMRQAAKPQNRKTANLKEQTYFIKSTTTTTKTMLWSHLCFFDDIGVTTVPAEQFSGSDDYKAVSVW